MRFPQFPSKTVTLYKFEFTATIYIYAILHVNKRDRLIVLYSSVQIAPFFLYNIMILINEICAFPRPLLRNNYVTCMRMSQDADAVKSKLGTRQGKKSFTFLHVVGRSDQTKTLFT